MFIMNFYSHFQNVSTVLPESPCAEILQCYVRGSTIKFANLILEGLFIMNLDHLDSQPSLLFESTEKAA